MSNVFLKVDKDLFGKGLNPIELLVYSQIVEFNTNTGDCFVSDKQFAEWFGVSESTVARALKSLEANSYIRRETKNVKGGRERHIFTTAKMTLVKDDEKATTLKMTNEQQSNWPLNNSQNDIIKDNNLKDNSLKDNCSTFVELGVLPPNPPPEANSKEEFKF